MARINDTTTYPITTPADDDLIIGTDVSNTTNNAGGETVNFLVSAISPKSRLLAPTDISAVANYDITFTPADYEYIEIRLSNFVPVTDAAELLLRTSSNGGSSFHATGYSSTVMMNNIAVSDTTGVVLAGDVGSDTGEEGYSGTVTLYSPNQSKRTLVKASGVCTFSDGTIITADGGGAYDTAEQTNAVRLIFSTGNIETGRVAVYGVL